MKSLTTALTFFAAILFTTFIAYASNTGPSIEELRNNMHQAKANATYLAEQWQAQQPHGDALSILAHRDPAQSAACPQGSGHIVVELLARDGEVVEVLNCSTVSLLLGCHRETQYRFIKYSESASQCAALKDVPYPLPALTMR